jgi:2',3'-cyclic-nucleotide 2'-phosphodiesterase (5'-nucleotidase family)
MNTFVFKRASAAIIASAAIVAAILVPTSASRADVTYAIPDAPTNVYSVAAKTGIAVHWTPVVSNPAVSNYVISAGPGTCPIIVDGNATSANMPIFKSKSQVTPVVQAVNELGESKPGVSSPISISGGFAASTIKSVQLLQLSDFHGAIEASSTNIGAAVLASAFAADRAATPFGTVTLSSGDNFGAAPPISSQFEEIPSVEALNGMKLDASTFGNHEHDRNLDHVKKVIGASNFQWVASNYSSLEGMTVPGKSPVPFYILNRLGLKVGVVGLNTTDTLTDVFPGNLDYVSGGVKKSITIDGSISAAQAAVDAAKKAGANIVVVLVHNGWNLNLGSSAVGPLVEYAKGLKGVAAVFGGHSHQKYNSVLGGTSVAEVRNSGVEYTRTQICVDTKARKVLGSSTEFIDKAAVTAAKFAPDADVASMVAKYKAQLGAKYDVKIGTVASVAPRGGTPAVERSGEAAIGSYTADALKSRYKTDFALINGGGIRDTLPAKGYVTAVTGFVRPATGVSGPYDVLLGDAYTIFPFGNTVSMVNITGKNLWAALENGVSQYPTAGRWPQVAGLKFTVDVSKPAGARIVSVTKTDGTPIAADDKNYSVATVDYMVYGGDGYTQFDPSKQVLGGLLVDVFVDALKADLAAGKSSVFATDGRETVIGK